MKTPLLYCIFAGLFFGTWPLLARFGNLGSGWLALLISVGTGVVALFAVATPVPAAKSILIGFIAGLMNGLGMLAYAKLIGWQGAELSRTIPTSIALMPVFAALGALILFSEPFTAKKILGIGFIVVA